MRYFLFFIPVFLINHRHQLTLGRKLSFLAELKITKMQQSMAEVKVESVDTSNKNSDLVSERDLYKQQQQSASDTLREVRTKLFSYAFG